MKRITRLGTFLLALVALLTLTIGCSNTQAGTSPASPGATMDGVSQEDMKLINELSSSGYETMTVEEFTKLFMEQKEKSETFYDAVLELGSTAWLSVGEADPFYITLYLTAQDYYSNVHGDLNSVYDNYFTEFGDFEGGADGAVSVALSWFVIIDVADRTGITVSDRDTAVVAMRENVQTILAESEKSDWIAEKAGDTKIEDSVSLALQQAGNEHITFSLSNFDLSVFE